ncbi:SGNH/GDSL hydrolase family protein [Emticicia sp. BO119]|uniref:SGNH/GDSL hydrolase family protein n=1 Tax=Emticicia sp. BO119 TaxID=2757768 RepID=UPI0015F0389B|nr:SGNH/GDSL hydrolase family protein [Emticicia sp. BO119]MBA4850070.1 SGNH/GDSL hydrolase family protein [Emticicia sp. BO119]
MSKLIKKVFPLIITFIISISIALLIGEFAIRLFYPQVTSPVQFFYDEKLGGMVPVPNQTGFKNYPGVYYYEYKNNDIGMRDNRKVSDYKKYPYKILCLGDSFTYGWGVNDNETFARILEKKINKDSVAVLNAGVSGAGTDYALRFFQVRGKELSPNTVIYFYFDNDINDNKANAYFHIENDTIKLNEQNSYATINALKKNKLVQNKIYNWLSSNSQLFGLIRYNVGLMWNKKVSEANKASETNSESKTNSKLPDNRGIDTTRNTAKQEKTDPAKQKSQLLPEDPLYHTYKYLSALEIATKKQGVNFFVFYIPAHTSLEEYQKSGTIGVENALNNYCRQNQIKFFSFSNEIEKVKNPIESLYLPVDYHWNKKGHSLAGNYLYQTLKQENIIP